MRAEDDRFAGSLKFRESLGDPAEQLDEYDNHNIMQDTCGCGSKLNSGDYAGFGPCFHLPGFHFGTGFLSHSHAA